ncbi:hypothetical protein GEMRC1_008072 [Eukaryota sp. GEM-RC1]
MHFESLNIPDFHNKERLSALWRPLDHSDVSMVRDLTSFWRATILKFLTTSSQCCFTLSHLNEVFSKDSQSPECFTELLTKLWQDGIIVEPQSFAYSSLAPFHSRALTFILKSPFQWMWRKVWTGAPIYESLLHLPVCRTLSLSIYSWLSSSQQSFFTPAFSLSMLFSWIAHCPAVHPTISSQDLECVAIYLIKAGKFKPIFSNDDVMMALETRGFLLKSYGIFGFSMSNSTYSDDDLHICLKLKLLENKFSFQHEISSSENAIVLDSIKSGAELINSICPTLEEASQIIGDVQASIDSSDDIGLSLAQPLKTDDDDLEAEFLKLVDFVRDPEVSQATVPVANQEAGKIDSGETHSQRKQTKNKQRATSQMVAQ